MNKVKINECDVWVDKDANIKEGDLVCGGLGGNDIKKYGKYFADDWYKIVAASTELNLEGVPTYVDFICEQEAKKFHDKGQHEDWDIYNQLVYEDKEMIIVGYRLAEKELPTWEDVRKAIEIVHEWYNSRPYFLSTEEIIEQLKKEKK